MKITILSLFLILFLFTGCNNQPKIKYVYVPYCENDKYFFLSSKGNKEKADKLLKEILKDLQKKEPKPKVAEKKAEAKKPKIIATNHKKPVTKPKKQTPNRYKEPTNTKIYAPKRFITRPNQKMNFMVGYNKDNSRFIYMEGEFGVDTYRNFLKYIKNFKDIKEIKINSNGGLVATAMKIGSYIKEHKYNTGVDDEMHCYSACGFVYFAGAKKSLQGGAKIGLHRPYIPNQKDTPKSIRRVKKEYISYWRYIKAPMDLYYEMMDVDRDNLFILDRNNINEYVDAKIY